MAETKPIYGTNENKQNKIHTPEVDMKNTIIIMLNIYCKMQARITQWTTDILRENKKNYYETYTLCVTLYSTAYTILIIKMSNRNNNVSSGLSTVEFALL